VVSVVIGGRSADGRGCGAAGTGYRRGHGGRLKRTAVERPRLEGTAGGAIAVGQSGGRSLEHNRQQRCSFRNSGNTKS